MRKVPLKVLIEEQIKNKARTKRDHTVLEHFKKQSFAEKSIPSITQEDINLYIAKRLDEVKPVTIQRDMTILRQIKGFCFKYYAHQIPRERRLQDGELELITRYARKCRNPYYLAIIMLAIETALRKQELLRLTWPDFNTRTRILSIKRTKTNRPRNIPLSPLAFHLLQAIPRIEERVFPITGIALASFWRKLRYNLKTDLRFHDLRHEAISRLFERGLTIAEVQRISGHVTWEHLRIYVNPRISDILSKLWR